MNPHTENHLREIMSRERRGLRAGAARLSLSAVELFYAGAMVARNRLYDAGILRSHSLHRPVISIGNLTAGGTGKTPMVRWLADRLRQRGRRVAVLSRGYKSAPGDLGDEQLMLDRLLNAPGLVPIFLRANPNRVFAAEQLLNESPAIDVFLLDDGFQHRRVVREMDIVLLNATEPFGFGHVLPRGLLREPIGGLRRAGAVVITHADEVGESDLQAITYRVREVSPGVPIFRAIHRPAGLRTAACASAQPPDRTFMDLSNMRFFGFCGIGNPQSFDRQLQSLGGEHVGYRSFADHHAYTPADLDALRALATEKGASLLLTTEKDWAKVAELPNAGSPGPEVWRIDVALGFQADGEAGLLELVEKHIPL